MLPGEQADLSVSGVAGWGQEGGVKTGQGCAGGPQDRNSPRRGTGGGNAKVCAGVLSQTGIRFWGESHEQN